MRETWPLLSLRHFSDYSSQEFYDCVLSMYREPERKEAARDWTARRNNKGTPVITIRNRKPKYLLLAELPEVAEALGLTAEELTELLVKKGIPAHEAVL